MRSWLLSVVAVVACLFLFASTADAQVFKPRTGSAARPAPVKTASAAPAAAPVKKSAASVAAAPATAAKKPARATPHRKKAKKASDDEETVVIDDGDADDVKVTDD